MELVIGFKTRRGVESPHIPPVLASGLEYIYKGLDLTPLNRPLPEFGFALRDSADSIPGYLLTQLDKAVGLAREEAEKQYGTLRSFRYEITGPYVEHVPWDDEPCAYMLIVGDCEPMDPARRREPMRNVLLRKVYAEGVRELSGQNATYAGLVPNPVRVWRESPEGKSSNE